MSKELQAALDALDLQAIIAIAETDTFMRVLSTSNPEGELRKHRMTNPRIQGISLAIYTTNEVVAGRIISRALELLEQAGIRRDQRWVGCTAQRLEISIRDAAGAIGAKILTKAERLLLAQQKLDREAAR